MKVILVANSNTRNIKDLINIEKDDYVVAIDGGFDLLSKQRINVDLVIGDLDSVINKKKLKNIEIIKLNNEKDFSDTFAAVEYGYSLSNNVFLIGGIQGNRIEHFISNMTLFNSFPNLMIIDENSKIYLLPVGKHLIKKSGYISFFPYEESVVSLDGFKYNLKDHLLKRYDSLGLSNEVDNLYGEIDIKSGKILVIESIKA